MFISNVFYRVKSSNCRVYSIHDKKSGNIGSIEPVALKDNSYKESFVKSYLVNFKGYDGTSEDYKMPMCTSFFRDIETLELATEVVKRNFPEGATILDYACSDGEEAISILALLDGDGENRYDIIGLDKSSSAIKEARKGRYREAKGYGNEGFLFNPYNDVISGKNRKLKDKFLKIMDETTRNEKRIYGYTVKEKYKDKIKFQPCGQGDIFDIDNMSTSKPVGAVFFRNAMYQLFGENFDPEDKEKLNDAKPAIINLITKIYNKLEPGGIFVSGSCYKDTQINNYISYYFQREMPGLFMPLNNQNNPKEAPTVWMKVK